MHVNLSLERKQNTIMIPYHLPSQEPDRQMPGFSAYEIPILFEWGNVAKITLTSRYPEKGFALNKQSDMLVYILEGAVEFFCKEEDVKIELGAGSTILVEKNKTYCWIPQGSVTMLVISSPAWTPEQHCDVEE